MILFVGLGNPESRYEDTRHNIGFKVVDALVEKLGARDISKNTFYGNLYRTTSTLFLKPITYMNLSGKSVLPVKQFFKLDLENIIVVHDDIDLPFGAVRFKRGGGNGGHNGLKSIDATIGKEYFRVRIGVGRPEYKSQIAEYVLHDFNQKEAQYLSLLIGHVAKACQMISQHKFNEVKLCYTLKSIEALSL
ncbi:MAG: aminoacyl-tRNA hydrolase [Sulfurovum sp.]|nr:aminoacyl-tRNA hydrolase [Sulfurovum sp.]MCB4744423.1 aminoacyl-tRNA hydrolase [Sulfurovum sp.]MCB4745883.1 aminoacyl-tRNA hydrolase [Sulfurovum sp.]MCB4747577.1 aminoacyl-tRNA hydrolase [Sulfurovum sp.]MCB4748950.1 aminoacyl-tRNA hydrolase [Sulfurovum sp.]